jgi:cell wall-associated NlpC family hydrolase
MKSFARTLASTVFLYRGRQRRRDLAQQESKGPLRKPGPLRGVSRVGARNPSLAQQRCVRLALGATVSAAVLAGASTVPAGATVAPSHAGWDGSKYWYEDAAGEWRWTAQYDKYSANVGAAGTYSMPSSNAFFPPGLPVFQGRAGWDATAHVYWYESSGQWRWTSHREKYERLIGLADADPTAGTVTTGADAAAPVSAATSGVEDVIDFANAQLGEPYVYGGNGPDVWDCSSLVQAAYRQAQVELPRVASDQFRATTHISRDQLQRGDLVFWTKDGSASGVYHVALYLGGDQYLEAPRPGRTVRVSTFGFFHPNLYGRP